MKIRLPRVTICIIISAINLLAFTSRSFSQHFMFETGKIKWEAGVNFGPSVFLGDLGGNVGKGTHFLKDVNPEFTNLMKGAFITAYPSDWFGIRIAGNIGKLEGDDAAVKTKGVDELWRKQRNLDFRTNILEAYVAVEIFPLMVLTSFQENQPKLRPYVVGGLGMFHFDPQGSLTDANGVKTWYYLRRLRTEGEGMKEYPGRKPYKLAQFNIPVGGGLKYFSSDRLTLSLELLYRKTFTDYIDDVSTNYIDPNLFNRYLDVGTAALARRISDKTIGIVTPGITRYAPGTERGNPKHNDAYFNLFIKLGIRLGDIYENSFDRNAAHQMRCPNIF